MTIRNRAAQDFPPKGVESFLKSISMLLWLALIIIFVINLIMGKPMPTWYRIAVMPILIFTIGVFGFYKFSNWLNTYDDDPDEESADGNVTPG